MTLGLVSLLRVRHKPLTVQWPLYTRCLMDDYGHLAGGNRYNLISQGAGKNQIHRKVIRMEWKCDLCGKTAHGKVSRLSNKIFFCQGCREIHWDGIGPLHEPRFIQAFSNAGIELPARNDKGWYPLS